MKDDVELERVKEEIKNIKIMRSWDKIKRLDKQIKKIKEKILSNKQLTQNEFDTIKNRSEEFKNIVFRKVRKCLVQL